MTKEIIQAVKEKNFEKGGLTTGKIVKVLLSWETNYTRERVQLLGYDYTF